MTLFICIYRSLLFCRQQQESLLQPPGTGSRNGIWDVVVVNWWCAVIMIITCMIEPLLVCSRSTVNDSNKSGTWRPRIGLAWTGNKCEWPGCINFLPPEKKTFRKDTSRIVEMHSPYWWMDRYLNRFDILRNVAYAEKVVSLMLVHTQRLCTLFYLSWYIVQIPQSHPSTPNNVFDALFHFCYLPFYSHLFGYYSI
jgi:hypothetical protein